ncbi:Uncharacterised protein [Mycobacteroides abscessus subsp. abscessus]|nr:Uncharacterised protein [Mycobacteroides abscessus subsp. abscessus]
MVRIDNSCRIPCCAFEGEPSLESTFLTLGFGYAALPRRSPIMTTTFNAVRRIWTRHRLTPQERANLQLAYSPLAVVSASLGAHPPR